MSLMEDSHLCYDLYKNIQASHLSSLVNSWLVFLTRYKFGVLDGATTWIFAKDNNELFDFDELTVQGGGHLAFNSSVSLTSPVDINVGMFYGDKTGGFYFWIQTINVKHSGKESAKIKKQGNYFFLTKEKYTIYYERLRKVSSVS